MSTSISSVISAALKDAGVDDPNTRRRATRRAITALAEDRSCVVLWVAELGVFKFVGYTNRVRPKTISPVAITREHVRSFIVNADE